MGDDADAAIVTRKRLTQLGVFGRVYDDDDGILCTGQIISPTLPPSVFLSLAEAGPEAAGIAASGQPGPAPKNAERLRRRGTTGSLS
jgi:hypothetical protein